MSAASRGLARFLPLFVAMGCAEEHAEANHFGKSEPLALQPSLPRSTHIVSDAGTHIGTRLPAFTQYQPKGTEPDLSVLAEVDKCVECHATIVEQWRESPHAHASFDNPWYRASVDAFRETQGEGASRFCAGCHDPLLLASKAIDGPIEPSTEHASAGVTCMVCHGIVETATDGRASFSLRSDPIPYPTVGDEESLRAHRQRMASPALRSVGLCGSCHRAHLDASTGNAHFLNGMDDLGAYAASAYAGSHAARIDPAMTQEDCSSCHMPPQQATRGGEFPRTAAVASHRMPGGQTALAEQTSESQLEATTAQLLGAATLDVGAVRFKDGRVALVPAQVEVAAGDELSVDIVLSNEGVGHHFPGGVRDTQDTWLQLEVRDATGCTVLSSGTMREPSNKASDTTHRLFTAFVDEAGDLELRHQVDRFEAKVFDHTLAPRDSRAVRYRFRVPSDVAFPLALNARLMHRRHNADFHQFVCERSASRRGQEFTALSGRVDPCRSQPVTELAQVDLILAHKTGPNREQAQLTGQAASDNLRPRWLRLYRHALALSHQLSEHLGEARRSLEESASLAPSPRERAQVLVLRATVEARQGRRQQALEFSDAAEHLLRRVSHDAGEPTHGMAAVWRARGLAHRQVWDFEAAVDAYRSVLRLTPRDTQAYRDLARALGSLGRRKPALLIAQRGLALAPRDSQLLRSQALALARVGSPLADQAEQAALDYREPDGESEARQRCMVRSDRCRSALVPVPTLSLEEQACAP